MLGAFDDIVTPLAHRFRAPFSSFLTLIGVGCLMALSFMYLVAIEPHQHGGGLSGGISDEYHGLRQGKTLFEAVLLGSMADKIFTA